MIQFMYPKSIAVIGVSESPTMGRNIVANLLDYKADSTVKHVREEY
jgi:acyl-CoA synthetase (NDP forming)